MSRRPPPSPPPHFNICCIYSRVISPRIDNPFDTRSNANASIAPCFLPHSCVGDTFYFVSDRLIMYAAVIPCHLRTIFPHLQHHYPFNNLTRKTTLLLTKPTGTTKPSMLTPEARDTSVFCCKDFNQGCLRYFQFTITYLHACYIRMQQIQQRAIEPKTQNHNVSILKT